MVTLKRLSKLITEHFKIKENLSNFEIRYVGDLMEVVHKEGKRGYVFAMSGSGRRGNGDDYLGRLLEAQEDFGERGYNSTITFHDRWSHIAGFSFMKRRERS
ncbi:MAG: hypothetical protein IIA87_04580 [Nanoarchaeota archaeon]|nr:hypothetical protein [Nanoarchaeota archaeon]